MTDKSTRGLGYHPDKPDERDHPFSAHRAAALALPSAASVDVATVAPKDQLGTSSCVGQAWSQALRLAYLKRGLDCPELSALFVYRLARNLNRTDGDDGTYLRSGARAVQQIGAASETSWPFSEAKVDTQLSFSADSDAFDRSGSRAYYRIAAGDTDGVRRALAAGLPVVGGWDVDRDFVSGDGRGLIDVQDQTRIAGGHALAIVAYKPAEFSLLNSWGPFFGEYGRFRATEGFVAAARDVWALDVSGGAQ